MNECKIGSRRLLFLGATTKHASERALHALHLFLAGLLLLSCHSEGLAQGKMLWDQIRERGQKNYEMIESEIRLNGEKWVIGSRRLLFLGATTKHASERALHALHLFLAGLLLLNRCRA
jgi:hypothetical protein